MANGDPETIENRGTGRPRREEHSDFVEVFRETDAAHDESVTSPVLTTKELTDELDLAERSVRRRLDQMHERGILNKKKAGQASVWWLVASEDSDQETLFDS